MLPDNAAAARGDVDQAPPASGFAVWLPWRRDGAAARGGRLSLYLGLGWLVLVVGAAVAADVLPLPAYDETLVGDPLTGPGLPHLLGTDALGRDLLSRIIFGARVSLGITVGALLICAVFGGTLGVVAGYFGGRRDAAIMMVTDVALAFPALVFALAVVAFVGGGFWTLVLVLGVLGVPAWTRIARGTAMVFARREFVLSAKGLGWRDRDVIRREIVPNVAIPVLSFAFVAAAVIIVSEGALAFLGLSVPPPTPTWGGLINEGRSDLERAPYLALAPAAVLFLTVLAFNVVGDRLRQVFDVRGSGLGRAGARTSTTATRPGSAPAAPPRDRPQPAALLDVVGLRTSLQTSRGLVPAVDDVSFSLRRGRTLAIVGESGSGKTMLIRSILGLVDGAGVERSGRVFFGDRELSGRTPEQLRDVLGPGIAAVFQNPMTALNPVRTIGTQLAEPLRVHQDMSRRAAWTAGEELLREVGIPEPERRMRQYPHQLSGGMLQRITIAMALSCYPAVLFADEPTTALDVTVQHQILRLLHRERTDRDMAMVLVSHDLAVVADWADEVIVMYAGKVVEQGPAGEVFARTRMPYTRALLESIPSLDDPSHTRLRGIEGRPPDPVAMPAGCPFHPRCPSAQDRCRDEQPPLVPDQEVPEHRFACWFPVQDDRPLAGLVSTSSALREVSGGR